MVGEKKGQRLGQALGLEPFLTFTHQEYASGEHALTLGPLRHRAPEDTLFVISLSGNAKIQGEDRPCTPRISDRQ